MNGSINSKQNKTGHRFTTTLESDLVVDNAVAVPSGTRVYGEVIESIRGRSVALRARLKVHLTGIKLNGQIVPIVTDDIGVVGDPQGTARKTGTGAIIGEMADDDARKGAKVGAGVALLTPGKQIEIPSGTILEFHLQAPLTVAVQ
jgi:hypothetical protein